MELWLSSGLFVDKYAASPLRLGVQGLQYMRYKIVLCPVSDMLQLIIYLCHPLHLFLLFHLDLRHFFSYLFVALPRLALPSLKLLLSTKRR
jgi:hypothetical protein